MPIIQLQVHDAKRVQFLEPLNLTKSEKTQKSVFDEILEEFCSNTSLHGLNHVMKSMFSKYERLLWCSLFFLGVLGIAFFCQETWSRFSAGSTMTVIETTRFPYSEVSFPSVTICDKSRVDWARAMALSSSEIGGGEASKEAALVLLKRLGYVTFGDFDFLDQIRLFNLSMVALTNVNITRLLLKTMRPCDEVFINPCWWRNQEYDCCTIFEIQRTELGFCWSFNSDTSEGSLELSGQWGGWTDELGERRPRRTAQKGLWSGLRIHLRTLEEDRMPPDGNHTTPGIIVVVSDPRSFPHSGYTAVSPGLFGTLAIWGDSLRARPSVRSLPPSTRSCLFHNEGPAKSTRPYYLADNCRYDCFRQYTLKYCNCSPDFLFVNKLYTGEQFPSCDVEGLLCLSKYNDIFTFIIPENSASQFFPVAKMGMSCHCLDDCNSHQYVTELFSPELLNISTNIILDVHFRLLTCVLYRTDTVYKWLDLLVSFGGIAGLFLGASLMSCVELIYFFTIRLFTVWLDRRTTKKNKKPILPFIK